MTSRYSYALIRSPLFRRYWLATSLIVTALLVALGALNAFLDYRQTLRAISERQQIEARAAAREIRLSLSLIEQHVGQVARLPWASGLFTDDDWVDEWHRLQTLVPSILQVRVLDARYREVLFVSRMEADRVRSGRDGQRDVDLNIGKGDVPAYGSVYHRNLNEPVISFAVRGLANDESLTIVDLDLRHLARTVAAIRVGKSGRAFLVDARDQVIAHPRLERTLGARLAEGRPQIEAIRQALGEVGASEPVSLSLTNADGEQVRSTGAAVGQPNWLLIVEEPLAEAMLPVREGLIRSLVLLCVGLLAAFVVSLWLAGKLTKPVLELRDGAVRLGGGDLSARLVIEGRDEFSDVAAEFNRMAERLERSYGDLESQVLARTQALDQANREVQRQADALNALNVELTSRVSELGLRREEADRANAAKTRFLAAASHDLRQPMHTISLLVGALKEQLQGRAAARLLEKITAAIESMEGLFGSLLDISKLDAGVVRPTVGEVHVSALMRNLEANFGAQAHAKGLTLRFVESTAVVRTDAALLERVLANLVANAINYTERGTVLVGCRFGVKTAQVWVVDTGAGIPAGRIQQVFEEFVQLSNPGRDRSKGLGLGLSIVKRTADLLGHRLIVRSTVGRGSTFGVEVPLVRRRTTPEDSPTPFPAAVGALKGAFVVVVDDAEENRSAMATLCEQWGCLVVSAASGRELYRLLETHLRVPDLIISDYRLNESEIGLDVIREIRRTAEAVVPAIVITGDVAPLDVDPTVARVVVLHKPLNAAQFIRTAQALLG